VTHIYSGISLHQREALQRKKHGPSPFDPKVTVDSFTVELHVPGTCT